MKPTSVFPFVLLATAVFAIDLIAQAPIAEPPELANARARYDQEVAPIKVRYAQSLETLKKALGAKGNLSGALAVQQEIDRLGLAQNRPIGAGKEAKVVVWNQHNGGYNDRGTSSINVALITNGKEVWRQNNIQIPWEAGKDTSVTVNVPAVPTEKLRVEVAESIKGRGGLAEVEYWKDGRNIAKKRRVAVSAVWESNAKCGGETLTDGITTSKDHQVGYWLVPNGESGWAEVALNTRD